jgi:hypothetical protein
MLLNGAFSIRRRYEQFKMGDFYICRYIFRQAEGEQESNLPSLESVSSGNSDESELSEKQGFDRIEKLEAIIDNISLLGTMPENKELLHLVPVKSVYSQTLSTGDIIMTSVFSGE